jgi:hypothetical protein
VTISIHSRKLDSEGDSTGAGGGVEITFELRRCTLHGVSR